MLNLRNKLNKLIAPSFTSMNNKSDVHSTSQCLVKNIAIDDKERLGKPRSQIKGVELLRNPSLYKVGVFGWLKLLL